MDVPSIGDMLAVEPAFFTDAPGGVALRGPAEILRFGGRKKGEKNRKKDEKKGENVNGGVIYVVGSNHAGRGFLPIIPYMDTCMRLE